MCYVYDVYLFALILCIQNAKGRVVGVNAIVADDTGVNILTFGKVNHNW